MLSLFMNGVSFVMGAVEACLWLVGPPLPLVDTFLYSKFGAAIVSLEVVVFILGFVMMVFLALAISSCSLGECRKSVLERFLLIGFAFRCRRGVPVGTVSFNNE
jgi:hypothetical protein